MNYYFKNGFSIRPLFLLVFFLPGCASAPHKPLATPTPEPSQTELKQSANPQVTAIPNPVHGTKMSFRVVAKGALKVTLKIYNHDLVEIKKFEQSGENLFDIIWDFKALDEGIYYFKADIENLDTDQRSGIPAQKFVVLKGEASP